MYFKILRNDLTHHGFTYQEGLNIDTIEFEEIFEYQYGLFFSDEKNNSKFCNCGDKIAIVTLPKDEKIVQFENKYKAHRIILSEIRDLWTIETFEWLIENGVDIHTGNDHVLCQAIEYGYTEIVKYLLKNEADVNADNKYFQPPLCMAIIENHIDIVKLLLENKADIHVHGTMRNTPLDLALIEGNMDIVKLLLNHGANIHSCRNNSVVLHQIALNGHMDTIKWLLDNGINTQADYDNFLIGAAAGGRVDLVEFLLNNGANICKCDNYLGWDALVYASFSNRIKVVKLLLEKGKILT